MSHFSRVLSLWPVVSICNVSVHSCSKPVYLPLLLHTHWNRGLTRIMITRKCNNYGVEPCKFNTTICLPNFLMRCLGSAWRIICTDTQQLRHVWPARPITAKLRSNRYDLSQEQHPSSLCGMEKCSTVRLGSGDVTNIKKSPHFQETSHLLVKSGEVVIHCKYSAGKDLPVFDFLFLCIFLI